MTIDITISFIIRLLLAFVFLRAVFHKSNNYHVFCLQLKAYRLLPEHLLPAVSLTLALVEAYLALSLLAPGALHPPLMAAALLSLYALAMAINLARGKAHLDCGCTGPSGFPQSVSQALVIRNLALAVLALMSALPITPRDASVQDLCTILLAGIAVVLIYGSIEQAIANGQRQRQYFARSNSVDWGTSP